MFKYAFIGGIITPMLKEEIETSSKGVIQYAADTLQKCYIEGLSDCGISLTIFNLPYIGGYPSLSSIRKFCNFLEKLNCKGKEIECFNTGFNNLKGYKNWSRYKSLKKSLELWVEANLNDKICLIVYAAHTPFMKACADIKKKYPKVLTVLIVPDLPAYMASSSKGWRSYLTRYNIKISDKLYRYFDGFVFLSDYMKEKIPVKPNNYVVIEGIYSHDRFLDHISPAVDNIKRIVYTGTLAERYGIMNLVKAFTQIREQNYRLIIVGNGDAASQIIKEAQKDLRINYLGQLPHEEVLKIQREGDLLVNPRTSEGEFTKYSFPSKTMEYLASGVPTLLNKLSGIPEEYYKYSFQPKDESIESLKNKIEEILNLSQEKREEFGKKARNFILEHKNPQYQCKILLQLCNNMYNNIND